jgi:Kef-type K+ transport system membrane component KefB
VGLLVAGVVLGQNGLKLLDSESDTIKLLSEIGKLYLMFVAGLEIDLEQFRKPKSLNGLWKSDLFTSINCWGHCW